MSYVFQGVAPFIRAAAARMHIDAVHQVRCESIWHVGRIQDSLGQLSRLRPEQSPGPLIDYAVAIRESLAATLQGIDDAIAEVRREMHISPAGDRVDPDGFSEADKRPIVSTRNDAVPRGRRSGVTDHSLSA